MDLLEKYTTGDMTEAMALMGAKLMMEVIDVIASGNSINWIEQNESDVTYAKKIRKDEGILNLNEDLDCHQCCDEGYAKAQGECG